MAHHNLNRAAEIFNSDIAAVLPVNTVFTKIQFSQLTGVRIESCNNRLRSMQRSGFLDTNFKKGQPSTYIMSEDQRDKLAKAGRKKSFNKKEKVDIFSNGQSEIDKLLFSTPFFK
jgi:hypothetical protein